MIKLFCDKCKSVWYTSVEAEDQTCDKCGARLKRININSDNMEHIKNKEIESD